VTDNHSGVTKNSIHSSLGIAGSTTAAPVGNNARPFLTVYWPSIDEARKQPPWTHALVDIGADVEGIISLSEVRRRGLLTRVNKLTPGDKPALKSVGGGVLDMLGVIRVPLVVATYSRVPSQPIR
jgi:hypothetical protein